MRKLIPVALLIIGGCATQEALQERWSADRLIEHQTAITSDFLQQHLEVIAHDSLEGRDTGTRGQKIAAHYIADFYRELGFDPKGDDGSYFQYYTLNAELTDSLVYTTYSTGNGEPERVDHSVESGSSTGHYIRMFGGAEPLSGEVVFAGFGVNDRERGVEHLNPEKVEGNWVLMFEDVPYVVNGDTLINPNLSGNVRLRTILNDMDAAGILLISDYTESEYRELAEISSRLMSQPSNMSLAYLDDQQGSAGFPKGFMQVSPQKAAIYLGLDSATELSSYKDELAQDLQSFSSQQTGYRLDYTPYDGPGTIEAENVIAYLEGADPELKDEVLVLMAHYDHVGIGQPDETGDVIYNGADDNGSGTVALMAIANAFNEAKKSGYKPRRSVLFLHVSGEEIGLLGSRYYSDHPVIPIEQTVANFNADMIGRSDPENIQAGDTDYVYLIGGEIISSGLDSLVTAANDRSVNMRLDRKYNDLRDSNQFYRRSDHWNFGRLGVPFVFFFTGVHEDYHRPSDTVDKIDFEKLTRVTRLIYTSTVKVTGYDGRPEVDNQEFIEITRMLPR